MAHFRVTAAGDLRKGVSQLGHKEIVSHINAWDHGVTVKIIRHACYDEVFGYRNGGSNGPETEFEELFRYKVENTKK
jgi:hypothetical protein